MHEKRFEGDIDHLRLPERVEWLEVQRVADLCLDDSEIATVLDVGTGTGLFAEAFSECGLSVSGVDVNPEILVAARRYVPTADFREGTAEDLPYQDGNFDLVFLGLVLHESDEPLQALKEARRVAGKSVCVLEWPYRDQPFGPPLAHRIKPEFLYKLFLRAGFRIWKVIKLTNTVLYQLVV